MGISVSLDWATVLAAIGELLGNPLVIAGVAATLALTFAPQIMSAVKSATTGKQYINDFAQDQMYYDREAWIKYGGYVGDPDDFYEGYEED